MRDIARLAEGRATTPLSSQPRAAQADSHCAGACAGRHVCDLRAARHGQGLLRYPRSWLRQPRTPCSALLLPYCYIGLTLGCCVQVDDFEKVGVDHIWAVATGDPEKVEGWARKTKLSEGRVRAQPSTSLPHTCARA